MAYGRLMLDLAGTELTAEEQQILQSPQVGGVILFARNIQSREQVTALNAQIRQASANLLIAVDQEGGRVQRLRDGFTPLPPMQLLADSVVQNPEVGVQLVRDTGWLMASEVLACGFDISFAHRLVFQPWGGFTNLSRGDKIIPISFGRALHTQVEAS